MYQAVTIQNSNTRTHPMKCSKITSFAACQFQQKLFISHPEKAKSYDKKIVVPSMCLLGAIVTLILALFPDLGKHIKCSKTRDKFVKAFSSVTSEM